MPQTSATVRMNSNGVVVIPQEVRKVLEIDNEEAYLDLRIRIAGQGDTEKNR